MIDYIKITIVFVVVVDYNIIVYCVTGNINIIIIVVCRFHCCYSTVQYYYYFPLDRASSVMDHRRHGGCRGTES